jgi:hypothetical protein
MILSVRRSVESGIYAIRLAPCYPFSELIREVNFAFADESDFIKTVWILIALGPVLAP